MMLCAIILIWSIHLTASQTIDLQYQNKIRGDHGMFGYSLSATPNTLIVGTLSMKGPEIPVMVVDRGILDKISPPVGVIDFGFFTDINPKYIIVAGNKAEHAVLFVYTRKNPHTLVAEINVGGTLGLTDVAIGRDNTIAALVHAYPRVYLHVYGYNGEDQWSEADTKILKCGLFDPKVKIWDNDIAVSIWRDHHVVEMYKRIENKWDHVQSIQPSRPRSYAYGLALSRNRIVLAYQQGREQQALIYERKHVNESWIAAGEITIPNENEKQGRAYEVSLMKDLVIVVVPTDGTQDTLAAKIFKKHNGNWIEYANLRADQLTKDTMNYRVCTDGENFVLISRIYFGHGDNAGDVYVYDLSEVVNQRKYVE